MREAWQETAERVGRQVGVPVTVGIVALTAVSVGAGLVLTRTGIGQPLRRADRSFANWLVEGRTPALDALTGASTVLADTLPVAVLWVAAMAYAAWRTRHWRIPMLLMAAIGGEKLTYLFTSLAVGRPRPSVPPLGHVFATKSFPSGHVGSAVALYGGLVLAAAAWPTARRTPVHPVIGVCAVTVVTGVVAFSRMYRGHHYLSDVVWGALLGSAWLALAGRVVLRPATGRGAGD